MSTKMISGLELPTHRAWREIIWMLRSSRYPRKHRHRKLGLGRSDRRHRAVAALYRWSPVTAGSVWLSSASAAGGE